MSRLLAVPLTLREANAFIAVHHRHSRPVRGYRWAVGATDGGELWGVAIVGRPLSRVLGAERTTAEVLRVCMKEGAPKGASSFLYGACWRGWRAMGGMRLVTYTLQRESGASLRGAGARIIAELEARDWSMERLDHLIRDYQDVYAEPKFRWEWGAPGQV